ncbi:hypothetical protein HK100_011916 [Physocladia obscura]|uniref:Uncharacterized protein n=1 Tax=Physocladia obscura TaxID=109957 RepID=A0AAD5XHZ5_9FUNG|nr:hypothetical protein HK100_011916 [Physocladia obscura]
MSTHIRANSTPLHVRIVGRRRALRAHEAQAALEAALGEGGGDGEEGGTLKSGLAALTLNQMEAVRDAVRWAAAARVYQVRPLSLSLAPPQNHPKKRKEEHDKKKRPKKSKLQPKAVK